MEQTLHNAFKRFSLGDELRAYTFLGCHAAERDGVHGYVFRGLGPAGAGRQRDRRLELLEHRGPADDAR